MFNEIVINIHPFEKRVAIIENNKLVELFIDKADQEDIIGNIYKGIVKDVLPGMGAAFIDIGLERTAFLPYSDIVLDYQDANEAEKELNVTNITDSANISKILKPGDELVVQIQKGPLGKKGARVTQQLSIPGKFLVFFPFEDKIAISRKIHDHQEKHRIRAILDKIKSDKYGLIVRTEAEGKTESEFIHEYNFLLKTWKHLEKQIKFAKAPYCIYNQNNLVSFIIRDLFNSKIDRLAIDDKKTMKEIVSQLKDISPELVEKVELYKEESPIFDAYGIEKEINTIFKSRIYLPSGGNIVIEQTEALCAIDINTGSFTGKRNYENTITQINIEAAEEIARQIRLRDLSGITIIDFIDMESEEHQQTVLSTLKNALKNDRARSRIYPFNAVGLVEITRKRTRSKPIDKYSEPCSHCNGSGRVLSKESVAMEIVRWLQRGEYIIKSHPIKIYINDTIHQFLKDNYQKYFGFFKNRIELEVNLKLNQSEFKVFLVKENKDITDNIVLDRL